MTLVVSGRELTPDSVYYLKVVLGKMVAFPRFYLWMLLGMRVEQDRDEDEQGGTQLGVVGENLHQV